MKQKADPRTAPGAAAAVLLVLAALVSCSRDAGRPAQPVPGPPSLPPPAQASSAEGKPQTGKPQAGTKMHRTGAGEPDATGWCVARSTQGAFSVMLPTAFNDSSVTTPVEAGVAVMTDSVGTVTEHETRFTAFRARRSDGQMYVSSLDEVAERIQKDGRFKANETIFFRGMPGVEISTEEGDRIGRMRWFKVDDTLYQLSVEYSKTTAPQTIDSDIERFFDSFKILQEGEP